MRRLVALSFALLLSLGFVSGQSTRDIRINEILVKNVDNYMDGYGHRSSWVELYNTGHSKLDIGGCYLVAEINGEEIFYRIPTGDPGTVIGPLGYCVFFCEGTGTKGTFYTNFTMDNIQSIKLLNAAKDEKKPIDVVNIDYAAQIPDVSIGYMTRADGRVTFDRLPQTTPNATNDTEPILPKSEKFRQMDPNGFIMALTAIPVVLSVLGILFIFFKLLGNYMIGVSKKKNAALAAKTAGGDSGKAYHSPDTGDEIAAIAMALQMFQEELHDRESAILTINKVARAYSPWSSKIYGLRQFMKK